MSAVRSQIIFLFICVIGLSSCFEEKTLQERGLIGIPRSQFGYRGVAEKSIDLKFEKDIGDVSEITAVFSAPYDYASELEYTWKLGSGVTLASGSLKGTLPSLEKNKKVKLVIRLNGFNGDEAKHVGFEVIGKNPNKRIYADGGISSRIEDSFEKIVQEVEKQKAEDK